MKSCIIGQNCVRSVNYYICDEGLDQIDRSAKLSKIYGCKIVNVCIFGCELALCASKRGCLVLYCILCLGFLNLHMRVVQAISHYPFVVRKW